MKHLRNIFGQCMDIMSKHHYTCMVYITRHCSENIVPWDGHICTSINNQCLFLHVMWMNRNEYRTVYHRISSSSIFLHICEQMT